MLNLFDTDAGFFDSEDDYMGRAVIFLKDVDDLSTDDHIPVPKWYPVKFALNDAHDAENGAVILCSFACVEYDYDFLLPWEDIELAERLTIPGDPRRELDMP